MGYSNKWERIYNGNFVNLLLNADSPLWNVKFDFRLLAALIKYMDRYNCVSITKRRKEIISKLLDVKVSTINKGIKLLMDCDILKRVDRGEYQVHNRLVSRGSEWRVRKEYIDIEAGKHKINHQDIEEGE